MIQRKNKRGMLGNLIGAFVMLMIGFTLYGTVSQVVDNSLNCVNGQQITIEQPIGQTNSFGGGGSGSFGGYDGQVHKSWGSKINILSAGNNSIGCMGDITPMSRILFEFTPTLFLIVVVFMSFAMFWSSFHNYWGVEDL